MCVFVPNFILREKDLNHKKFYYFFLLFFFSFSTNVEKFHFDRRTKSIRRTRICALRANTNVTSILWKELLDVFGDKVQ